MLTSISPLGERARGNRWPVTVAWITLGAITGGAALGASVGALGQVIGGAADAGWRLVVLAVAAAAAAVWDLAGGAFPGHRQVNEDWLSQFRSWLYGVGFGAQLGAGFATVVNTSLVPLFALAALLADDVLTGLVIGAVFGLVRGLSMTASRGVRTTDDLRELHRRLDGLADCARRYCAGVAAALSGVAVLTLLNA